ncbi:MAG TPA: LapA family protein, partial [Ignavibacteriaceae bacterium]
MRLKIIVISILFLLVAIIASQNTITTELKFLFWSVQAPLIVMIVVIFILGLVIGLISSSNYERKKKKK